MTEVFWAQSGRLYHALASAQPGDDAPAIPSSTALCGRYIPPPRMTVKESPLDDERCAKCDRALANIAHVSGSEGGDDGE